MKRDAISLVSSTTESKRFHAVVRSAREDGRGAARASLAKRGFVRTRRIVNRVADGSIATPGRYLEGYGWQKGGCKSGYIYGWTDGALDALVDHAYRHERTK